MATIQEVEASNEGILMLLLCGIDVPAQEPFGPSFTRTAVPLPGLACCGLSKRGQAGSRFTRKVCCTSTDVQPHYTCRSIIKRLFLLAFWLAGYSVVQSRMAASTRL